MRTGVKEGQWETYAIGEVFNQVVDLDLAGLELAIEPAAVWLAAWYGKHGGGGRPFGKCFLLDLDPLLLKRSHGGRCA